MGWHDAEGVGGALSSPVAAVEKKEEEGSGVMSSSFFHKLIREIEINLPPACYVSAKFVSRIASHASRPGMRG